VINMANRNGTGPEGKGSRTGRGLGDCSPVGSSQVKNGVFGRGRGAGRGMGLGRNMGNRINDNRDN
jgi:hypothetical protein